MFALFRRRMDNLARCSAKVDGLIDDLDLAKGSMLDRRGHAEVPDLRVGKDFIHSIDRAAGYACFVQDLDQLSARTLLRDIRDGLIEGNPVFGTGRIVGKKRILEQMIKIERLAKAREDM